LVIDLSLVWLHIWFIFIWVISVFIYFGWSLWLEIEWNKQINGETILLCDYESSIILAVKEVFSFIGKFKWLKSKFIFYNLYLFDLYVNYSYYTCIYMNLINENWSNILSFLFDQKLKKIIKTCKT
jgi:hypothetical protein